MSIQNSPRVSKATENMAKEIMNHAKEQGREIIREAENKAAEIISKAKKEAEERRRKLVEQGKSDLERFKEQELLKIKMEFKKKFYEYAWSLVSSIISGTVSILEKTREQKEEYGRFLKQSLADAFNLIDGEEIIVHADKRDEKLIYEVINNLQKDRKIRIMFDLTTVGGLIATSENGLQELDETIETRLRLKNKVIREKLYNFLFGGLNAGNW